MNEITLKERAEISNPFASPEGWRQAMVMAEALSRTSIIPASYAGKPEDCLIALEMANRMNVSPMFVMQNLYVVKGKPSWSGQACMALIKSCGKFKDVEPVYTGERGRDSWGCRIRAVKADTGEIVEGAEVTIAIAKVEGWFSKKDKYGNETSKWQTMPQLMLAYRAASWFARVYVPDALMGCLVEGEAEDISPPEKRVAIDPFDHPDESAAVVIEEVREDAAE